MYQEEQIRSVIFLDIDGVLQPHINQDRFKHDRQALRRTLAEKFSDSAYLDMDEYDLAAIYYDWDKGAVERLRSLCQDFRAEIVVISDWRRHASVDVLKAFFRIHNLHWFVKDKTGTGGKEPYYRAGEVKEYLDSNPDIERFVIIDDDYYYSTAYAKLFPGKFVKTDYRINFDHEALARQILSSVPAQEE